VKRARDLEFSQTEGINAAIEMLVRVRFAECLSRQAALFTDDDETMHAFRLACKRLRYAIERHEQELPHLQSVAEFLAKITDELGSAHDCVVLAERSAACKAALVAVRARRDRDGYVAHARRLWRRAFRRRGALSPLAAYVGFRWELTA